MSLESMVNRKVFIHLLNIIILHSVQKQLIRFLSPFLVNFFVILIVFSANAQFRNIHNDVFWNTKNGQPIFSQGGGIFKFLDPVTGLQKYYWYGVHYKEADIYRDNPTASIKSATFQSVTCYSSTDLVNWNFEGDVLTAEELMKNGGTKTWVGRLGVAYLKELNKYVLIVQHGKGVLFAVSNTPTEPFVWHQHISMKGFIGTDNTGDQTVFNDEENGKSYLIYSYGKGRNKLYVSEIGVKNGLANLLDCTQVFKGESREGNCMFKYGGKYYMCASNIYGWDASLPYYLVSNNIRGPYRPERNMLVMNGSSADYAHITQTGFFVSVKGSKQETIVYCGDRWADFAGNGLGYNQWTPLSFDGAIPYFNSINSWDINSESGEWRVANDNNYVSNGSFEADRRIVPMQFKPKQLQLTGWVTKVIEGNSISFDTSSSPVLNHFNNTTERNNVIGEKSLAISDRINFKRNISQVISSSNFVKLEDGNYALTAKVKNGIGFNQLEMYAISKGVRTAFNFNNENDTWKEIKLINIEVKDGKVEIGFDVEGNANSFCYVDDIALVKAQ